MWMLNYPFPYDSIPVKYQYKLLTKALYKTITNINSKAFKNDLKRYISERKKFRMLLTSKDYNYFSFQIWQEGLARYTEYKFLESLADYYASTGVAALQGYISFNKLKKKMFADETQYLLKSNLEKDKRINFYSFGFSEGLLLDKLNTNWRKNYLTDKFFIEHYARCFVSSHFLQYNLLF